MRKIDKAKERALSGALTRVCHVALDTIPGFVWITHFVNFNNFPDSLVVVSVFGTDEALSTACTAQHHQRLSTLIRAELQAMDPPIKISPHQIHYDTEEACERDNNGNWQQRYQPLRRTH